MFEGLRRLFGRSDQKSAELAVRNPVEPAVLNSRGRAVLADCEKELERTIRAHVYYRVPRDRDMRESLLQKAASAGLSGHVSIRRLDFLHRLIGLLDTDPSREIQDSLLAEAGAHGLDDHSGVRALREYRDMRLLEELGPQAITRDQQGREVYFRRNAEFKNKSGQLEIRGDGLTFSGEVLIEIAWDNVVHVAEATHTHRGDDYKAIAVQERKRRASTKFAFPSNQDAAYAFKLIVRLRQNPPHQSAPPDDTTSSAASPVRTTIDLPGDSGAFTVGVVGESSRQAALRALGGERRRRGENVSFTAVLIPEPANPYDGNAVRVHIYGGAQVGYLSREDALAYQAVTQILAAQHAEGICQAKLIGGTPDKPNIGVVLSLAQPEEILQVIAPGEQPF